MQGHAIHGWERKDKMENEDGHGKQDKTRQGPFSSDTIRWNK